MKTLSRTMVSLLTIVALVGLLPPSASAAACFSAPLGATLLFELAAVAGGFGSFIGEFILPVGSTPIMATAHLRPNGSVHIAGTMPRNVGVNDPFTFEGIFPGSWTFQRLTGAEDSFSGVVVPTACVPVPEGPEALTESSPSPWTSE